MFDLTKSPQSDPTAIYRQRDALYAMEMLIVALKELDLFSWIARGPQTKESICQHYGFVPRPVDVMTTFLVASGWLERIGDSLALTTEASEHLVEGSPWFIGPYFPPVTDRPIAADLLELLKTGEPARFAGRDDHKDWHAAMETEAFAREFTAMMDCRGVLLAQALAKQLQLSGRKRLLDIAGGSGIYACSLAAHFPGLNATVLEKEPVDAIARHGIGERGFSERVDTLAMDILKSSIPKGYDVHSERRLVLLENEWEIQVNGSSN